MGSPTNTYGETHQHIWRHLGNETVPPSCICAICRLISSYGCTRTYHVASRPAGLVGPISTLFYVQCVICDLKMILHCRNHRCNLTMQSYYSYNNIVTIVNGVFGGHGSLRAKNLVLAIGKNRNKWLGSPL